MMDNWEDLNRWNHILYRDREDIPKELLADWFWDNFQIESYPKFQKRCMYHIPSVWGPAVEELITTIKNEFGDEVEFIQIKEKFCELIVYFRTTEEIQIEVDEMIEDTRNELRKKGLHP